MCRSAGIESVGSGLWSQWKTLGMRGFHDGSGASCVIGIESWEIASVVDTTNLRIYLILFRLVIFSQASYSFPVQRLFLNPSVRALRALCRLLIGVISFVKQ